MNENMRLGSMLPQIDFAHQNDMGVVIMNPNEYPKDKEAPEELLESHSEYVWQNYVESTSASSIYMIAHSAGGWCA